ncbi:PRC-barrel domain-containing protein [Candidatus Saccharibacteria bacterium]|nr:PRC-barrel domain-containing protein [Candidatus Saccharibacteria bacterium]
MLVTNSQLIGAPVLSIQTGSTIGTVSEPIIDPDTLKIIALKLSGPLIRDTNILDIKSIREYSNLGMVIDDIDELVTPEDIIKISKIIALNFNLIGLKVETKKQSKLGKIIDYTLTPNDFVIQQIIVRRPIMKALIDPELTISRKEIVEVTDYKVIIKDEEKTLKSRAEHEDFIPNFVNPFRKQEADYNPSEAEEE